MKLSQNTIYIKGEYVTLGQILKFLNLVQTGGEERLFLETHKITFNDEPEGRRGKKVRPGDKVSIDGTIYTICSSDD